VLIVIEIATAITMLGLGLYFWSCVKARKYLSQLLADESKLKQIITIMGKDAIIREAETVQPSGSSFGENIEVSLYSGIKAIDKTSNVLLVAVISLVVASYFMGSTYLIINDCIAIATYFFPIRESAKNRVVTDVQSAVLIIYKWNTIDLKKCRKYCTEHDKLKILYKLVNRL